MLFGILAGVPVALMLLVAQSDGQKAEKPPRTIYIVAGGRQLALHEDEE